MYILSYSARIAGPTALVHELAELRPRAPAWTTTLAPALSTTFDVQSDTPRPGWHTLWRNGTLHRVVKPPTVVLAALDTAINAAAVEALDTRYLLIHAGAVAFGARGLLLPAAAGSGKSTLVAGLVAAGFQYLSDEVGVVDPETMQLLPFAKRLYIKAGGARALAGIYPELTTRVPRLRSAQETIWYLAPPSDAWPAGPVTFRYVVVPQYVAGARTELAPMPRTAALSHVVGQSYRLQAHGGTRMGHLIEAMRAADCYALTIGSLRQAVDQLQHLVTRPSATG
ncbi:MAG: hypothetical protein JOZ87_15770 [Chloroflexi bacterium]|nr:hypothetical protein [Chloroflexota bacterium]